jgi:hypothetical protein
MKTLISATCLLLTCAAVRAGGLAATNLPVVETKATAAAAYIPKSKSVFTGSANGHNPFWPIGWIKTADESADSAAPMIPHAEDFMVTTILLNDPPMAVINGKDLAEGEIAVMPVNGANVTVQLMAVQDGRVVLRWENQNIVVPIHRDEDLSQASPSPVLQ